MDTQLFARMCRTIDESDSNRVWVHPTVAGESVFCVAFFNGKQAIFAVGTDDTISPCDFYLAMASRKHLTCDYENARVYFKGCDRPYDSRGTSLVLDLQIANVYADKSILHHTYDADQLRCEMFVMFHKTVFERDRLLTFMHRNIVFHVTPQSNFVFYHDGQHRIQLTHKANTCFNLFACENSDAIAEGTPYLTGDIMY